MSSRGLAFATVIVSSIAFASRAGADHGFAQFGGSGQTIAPGEGVEFVLGGVPQAGVVDPSVVFHLRLFFDEGAQGGPPERVFSSGDVLRFTLGGTSVVYEFDHPSHILGPPFYSFGFYDANNIDDVFGSDDSIGLGLSVADSSGETMTLEVLAGDGVRFSGLEIADLAAGSVQKCGASTFVRKFSADGGTTALVDFDDLSAGETVTTQYATRGVAFWGDVVFDEQYVIGKLGAGMNGIESRFLLNGSATPPLGRGKFVGLSFEAPVHALRFDYATRETELRVAGFDGAFAQDTLVFIETFSPSPGPTPFLEGQASIARPESFDGVILPAKSSLLLDHLEVTFRRIAFVDFEGFSLDSELRDQLAALGVHFFGDGLANERAVIDAFGAGYERLEGNFLVNDTATPPVGRSGMVGMKFDGLASRVSFDFSGPSPLQVVTFRGEFLPENIVEVRQFTTSIGATGFSEGQVVMASPGGFDGLVVTESHDGVVIDNLEVEFSQP